MSSDPETAVAVALKSALSDVAVGEPIPTDARTALESSLEFYIPQLLGWRGESLDGFRFCVARKIGVDSAEFLGVALLITDQTWTPTWLLIRHEGDRNGLREVHCRFGERDREGSGMRRLAYHSRQVEVLLRNLPEWAAALDWLYEEYFDRTRAAQRGDEADER